MKLEKPNKDEFGSINALFTRVTFSTVFGGNVGLGAGWHALTLA